MKKGHVTGMRKGRATAGAGNGHWRIGSSGPERGGKLNMLAPRSKNESLDLMVFPNCACHLSFSKTVTEGLSEREESVILTNEGKE